MATSITTELVLDSDGRIDSDATEAVFHSALVTRIAERELEQGMIAEKVLELFEQFKGSRINLPAIASMVAQKLNAQPANFKVISERVANYVRENADGKGAALFTKVKGPKGGVGLVADQPATVEETK